MAIQSLFPSFITQSTLSFRGSSVARKNQEFVDEIFKIKKIDDRGRQWSREHYQGGYTSYDSFNELHKFSSSFEELQRLIDQEVREFTKHLQMDLQGRKLVMTNMWVNVMPSKVQHSMHIHPLSTVSGTYYVQTPDNCAAIKFEDPRMGYFMASPPRRPNARPENQRFFSVQPKAGQVILFESWMRHEVPLNASKEERISVSFNYDWI